MLIMEAEATTKMKGKKTPQKTDSGKILCKF